MQARILPVAALSLLLSSTVVTAESPRMAHGRAAYEAGCAKCHKEGNQGAPVTSRAQDWTNRSDLWESVLVDHASKGYIDMPAKGGNPDASDYDVHSAVEYMLTITHPEMPAD